MGPLEIPALPDTAILVVEVGSTAHGTWIPGGEDHDELVVAAETPVELVGFDERWFITIMLLRQPEGERGEVPFAEWWDRLLALDAELESMADDDTIPPGPDRTRIEQWSVHAHQTVWASLP